MKEVICTLSYVILAILFFLRLRMLDGAEQRERQMCVTRRRWLRRRLFYILAPAVVCGSLMTGASGFLLEIQGIGMVISKEYLWISSVLIIMVLVTFYYLMALSGKVLLIYFGTLILWISLSALLPVVFSLPQLISLPAACWCAIVFFIWLILYIFYRKLFLQKDLGEDLS